MELQPNQFIVTVDRKKLHLEVTKDNKFEMDLKAFQLLDHIIAQGCLNIGNEDYIRSLQKDDEPYERDLNK